MNESNIYGVSVRAILVFILTATVCLLTARAIEIKEPLYSAFMLALGFYFGQKTPGGKNDAQNPA